MHVREGVHPDTFRFLLVGPRVTDHIIYAEKKLCDTPPRIGEIKIRTVILGHETTVLEGIELLRHGGDTGDVLIDVDPPAGATLIEEEDDRDNMAVTEDVSKSLISR